MTKKYLAGKVKKSHGISGEIKVTYLTNTAEDFVQIKKVYIKGKELDVDCARITPDGIILKLNGVNSRNQADLLTGDIWVDKQDMPELPEGQYYIVDLLGAEIIADNNVLGKLTDIQQFGYIDTYVVKGSRNFAFPALKEKIIKSVDLENHKIFVDFGELDKVALYEN